MKERQKQQIAGRIFEIIHAHSGSVTGFRTAAREAGLKELHSNSRFWLPQPTPAWRWSRAANKWVAIRGRSAQSDWEAVRIPTGKSLVQFCTFTNASADYILFGEKSAYRGETRQTAELGADLANFVWRRLHDRGVPIPDAAPWIRPAALLDAVVDAVQEEIRILARQLAEEEPLIAAINTLSECLRYAPKVSPAIREEWKVTRAALISVARQRHLPTSVIGSGRLAISTYDRSETVFVARVLQGPHDEHVFAPAR